MKATRRAGLWGKREAQKIGSGDGRAFDRLYADFAPRVLGYLRLLTENRAAAEDLLQETFLAAYSGRDSYKGTASPLAWLLGIARRRFRDSRRFSQRAPKIDFAELNEATPDRQNLAAEVERREYLRCCLQKLEPSLRDAVKLVLSEGLTYAEAAEVLEEPVGTIKWRVHRATRLLREMLAGEGEPE